MSGGIERIGWAVRLEDGSWSDSKGWNVPWPQMMDQETAEFVARSWREDADEEDRDDAQAILFYTAPEGTIESLEAERDQLKAREEHFASVLGVADGGQYRNDWDARITAVLAERDELRAQNAALMDRICNCPHNARAEAAHHADWCDVRRALNPEEEA